MLVLIQQYCNTPSLDPKKEEEVRWKAACREVFSHFVENMLTREPQPDAKLSAGVRINGARIVENINLENVMLICAIEITDSRIEGAITIRLAYGKRDPTRWLTDE
jgi:hypothetical protein